MSKSTKGKKKGGVTQGGEREKSGRERIHVKA